MDNLPNVGEVKLGPSTMQWQEVTPEEKAGLFIPPDHCTCDERKAKVMDVVAELSLPIYLTFNEITCEPDYKKATVDMMCRVRTVAKRLQEIFS